jgi:aryl-alcohol dehydrogenase-like predicted oxidoreductase
MQYTHLGRTGLKVSRLCLGTMNFGPYATPPESFAMMDRAHDLGINFFDTADVYGRKRGEGVTEQIIGDWFAKGDGRREKTVLATKVYGDMGDWPNESRLSALHIRQACDASLKRLKTDYIDLYQMHHVWREAPWEEIWQAMELLVQQGKVLYVGSSNFAGWHIAVAQCAAKSRHFMGLVSEQSKYSLLDRMLELDVIPACEHFGLGLIPWSPLSGGLLAGNSQDPAAGKRRQEKGQQDRLPHVTEQLKKWEAFCQKRGWNPAVAALAWTLQNKVVTAPIIGPRTLAQLEESIPATELKFDEAALKQIDEIFPGYKTAPEHYAW